MDMFRLITGAVSFGNEQSTFILVLPELLRPS